MRENFLSLDELNIDLLGDIGGENPVGIEEMSGKDIAVIGIAVKLPMADNLDKFWENVKNGVDCVSGFPESRRRDMDCYIRSKNPPGKQNRYATGAYLEEIDKFDHRFFRMTPKEARLMNPNQRLFLQVVWEAVEDAGYGGGKISGTKTGIYVGYIGDLEGYKYWKMITDIENSTDPVAVSGNLSSAIAGRISYMLDFDGPSMLIDTACSSSLVAVHLACQALRNNECELAVAGGVRISILPLEGECRVGIESSDGRARTFDNDSDGTGIGEGVVAVVLKQLIHAQRDGDNIYAVIKGSAVNQDGNSVGISAPNVLAQEKVIVSAWEDAGIDPETVSYIEAHGTGTKLGDPVEVDGIQRAFRRYTNKKQFCAVGSVKTVLGHSYEAAGITGLVKSVLSLRHQAIPPNIHFKSPNRKICFEDSAVYVNDRLVSWETDGFPRRCGVSAFGFTGTNCHVILEEAPKSEVYTHAVDVTEHVLVISAKTKEALKVLAGNYGRKLEAEGESLNLGDICYTAAVGRGHYNFRLALIVKDKKDLEMKMKALSGADLEKIHMEGVFYGGFRVVPDTGSMAEEGSITKGSLMKLDEEARTGIHRWKTGEEREGNILREICLLYVRGANISWEDFFRDEKVRRVSLPPYPFERIRCWVEAPAAVPEKMPKQEECKPPVEKPVISGRAVPGKEIRNSGLERIVAQQLDIMADQLRVIRSYAGMRKAFHGGSMGPSAINRVSGSFEEFLIQNPQQYENPYREGDAYSRLLLLKAFQEMGAFRRHGECCEKAGLMEKLGIIDKYEVLLECFLNILERAGYISIRENLLTATEAVESPETLCGPEYLQELKQRVIMENPDMQPYIKLVETCVCNYKDILTGKTPAVAVVFPDASMELVENVYKGNGVANFYNRLAARYVEEYIQAKARQEGDPQKVFKVLEIGAGTGGMSLFIMESIKNSRASVQYFYTDISLAFTNYGRKTYGERFPFVKFKMLDIEKDIEAQGFALKDFDIVLASNVVHATSSLKNTLKQIKKLLKGNGLLLLNEITTVHEYAILTFGLLDGWWLYKDKELRLENSPLLSPSKWLRVLESEGFHDIKALENTDPRMGKGSQSLVLGETM